MKAAKWRDLSDDEVTQKIRELSEEVFNLRFQLAMGMAKNPARMGEVRRDLARAYTIIRERGGAPAAVAAVASAPAPAPTAPAKAPRRTRASAKAKPARTRSAKTKKVKG